jgi:sterol desaturase/sphingolipid hydroxylase (fatty acid hydroxylase superfamily)
MLDVLATNLATAFDAAWTALFERVVQPLAFHVGLGNLVEDAFIGTGWLLVGLLQLAVLALVIGPLQRWRPVEPVTDRAAIRVDILYTLLHRLGLFRLILFFSVDPLWNAALSALRDWGVGNWQLDQWVASWAPGITDNALVGFLAYLVVLDFVDYALHRAQHQWNWWWNLHALHHSQRQLTMWSDNRNHLLDDLLRDALLVAVGRLIGIAPEQFIAVVACTQLLESLSHANVRMSFGPVLGRLLVSPRYHRWHHSVGEGHESRGPGSLGGHNFAVLFPVWDVLFGTAEFSDRYTATGIRDQLPEGGARDYGRGFWRQQWLGLLRLAGRDRSPARRNGRPAEQISSAP